MSQVTAFLKRLSESIDSGEGWKQKVATAIGGRDQINKSPASWRGFLLIHCYDKFLDQQSIWEEQLKVFIAKVQADSSLQEQLKAEGADVVAIAKTAGFSITTEDLNAHRQALSGSELSLNILTDCKNIFLLM